MVGETGFEPATPWSQTRCATSLRHSPTALRLGIPASIRKRHNAMTPKISSPRYRVTGTLIATCCLKRRHS